MLEKDKGPTTEHAFLVAIELQPHMDVEAVRMKLADSVGFVEGCGTVEVNYLGELPPEEKDTPQNA